MVTCEERIKKDYLKKFWYGAHLKKKKNNKRKTWKFLDAVSNNWIREKGINNREWIDREEWRR